MRTRCASNIAGKRGTGRGDDGDMKPGEPAENWGKEVAGCEGVRGNVSGQWGWQGKGREVGAGLGGFRSRSGWLPQGPGSGGNMRGRCLNNLGPRSHGVLWAMAVTRARLNVGEFELGTM